MDKNQLKPLQVGSRPTPPGIPNPTCPILMEAKSVLEKAQDLHRAIRRLRRATQRCITCPENTECPTTHYFTHALDTAVREVWQEWGVNKE